jgi:kynurenine formamidase
VIVVDLTHKLTPDAPVVPGDPPVTLARFRSHDPDGYQVTAVCLGSHSGTHLDAPRHFFLEGATLDSYPADRFLRPGWIVDVRPPTWTPAWPAGEGAGRTSAPEPTPLDRPSLPPVGVPATPLPPAAPAQASGGPDVVIQALASLTAGRAPLPAGGGVSFVPAAQDSGIAPASDVPSPVRIDAGLVAERLKDTDIRSGDFLLLWTGGALLADDAVPLLLDSGAGLVGTDGASLDEDPFPAHRLLLGAGLLLAENLANLERLGPGPVMCAFLPLALPDADGAPVRAVAWR